MDDRKKLNQLLHAYYTFLLKSGVNLDSEIEVAIDTVYTSEERLKVYKRLFKRFSEFYEQAVKDDKGMMSELIQKAKGPDRTMAEFSEAVGTSASTLSRAVNQKNTRPLSVDVLVGIADNAAEGSGVEWEDLLRANGYRKKRVRPVSIGNEIWDKDDRRKRIRTVVQNQVLLSGAQIAIADRYAKPCPEIESYCLDYGYPSHMEIIMKTNMIDGVDTWVVQPCSYAAQDDGADQVGLVLGFISNLLLIDRWRPDLLSHIRYTIAIEDEVMYDALVTALKNLHASTNNCFTVLLVDTQDDEFVEEYVLPSPGNNYKSVLDMMKKGDTE